MENQNFTLALVDKNMNMFIDKQNGMLSKIANIIEHDQRVDEISVDCQFFIDENMYKALGNQGVSFKYTKVFVKNTKEFFSSKYAKVYPIEDLHDHIRKYNTYDKNKPLFLAGGTEFTKIAMKFSSKLLMTVTETFEENGIEKFPMDEAKEIYKGRKEIEPVLLKEIRKYKKDLAHKRSNEFEIGENGMKIFKEPTQPKFATDIMNTPDYKFYEFRR